MSITRLKDIVRNDGEVITIDELDKRGMIEFKKVERFQNRKNTAYFADIKGTSEGWEISRMAYLSRTKH